MRCPKCDYISFDKEEICRGCKKNIGKFSKELSGVVLRGEVPDFLWFQKPEDEPEPDEASAAEEESPEADIEEGVDFEEEPGDEEDAAADNTVEFAADLDLASPAEEAKEIEFDLSADSGAAVVEEEEAKEEIAFDLSSTEEALSESVPAKEEKEDDGLNLSMEGEDMPDAAPAIEGLDDLDFGLEDGSAELATPEKPASKPEQAGKQMAKEHAAAKESELDLSGLDLSGLMPSPLEEQKSGLSLDGIGELSLESGGSSKAGGKKKSAADVLPDLSLDGLDLPAARAEKKLQPAAKTGTALDNFDIDLGDLLSTSKEGKKKK